MAIARMKRLHLIALQSDRSALMEKLVQLGCVHLSEPEESPDIQNLLKRDTSLLPQRQATLRTLQTALAALQCAVPHKGGLLTPRPKVTAESFLDDGAMQRQLETAERVNDCVAQIEQLQAKTQRLQTEKMTLLPWRELDLPLEQGDTRTVRIVTGTLPAAVDQAALQGELSDRVDAAQLYPLGESREQKCVLLLCHKAELDAALEVLRSRGFAVSQLTGMSGTVEENLRRLDAELKETQQNIADTEAALQAMGEEQTALKQCIDRIALEIQREESHARLLTDECIFYLDGWVPEKEVERLELELQHFDCAWQTDEPTPEEYEQVPVKLENNRVTRSLNSITEMYSLPRYGSVDPNPLMAPFFIFFFGMMMADMAYGILMIAGALLVLKKAKPAEGTRNFMELVLWCGIATFIVGAMTGGFFGDFIPQLCRLINPESTFELPALFSPLNDTVAILIGSLVLGVIQIFTGMGVSVYRKFRSGCVADAVWGEITWWVILLGLALAILKIGSVAGVPVVLCVGILMLVYGSTYKAKGFGKVTALIAAVYNGVTGYFSDILSYVRLMALMLAGSVLAQVFNTLGGVFGSVVFFVIVSLIGNMLNLALNLLGCYVHDMRLQFLEFFGRFYEDGGKAYQPLGLHNTKYVEIIKEEQ
ncbi:MAG: V-type ATP synthase subunit I [Oscillospiraceae bacterium]|nr:V-type ATP synthase subunit I [Oscillospiraceae bacterium]